MQTLLPQAQDLEAAGVPPPAGEDPISTVYSVLYESEVYELEVEVLSDLKPVGWAVPHLQVPGMERTFAATGTEQGLRTLEVHLSDGEHTIGIAETRVEVEGAELEPMLDHLGEVIDVEAIAVEDFALTAGGHEARLYVNEDNGYWIAGLYDRGVHYVISSDVPVDKAAELASLVVITDRARVQVAPENLGPADRLERGFDQMMFWMND